MFRLRLRNDNLTEGINAQPMFFALFDTQAISLAAKFRLQRNGIVIKPRMQHPAIVTTGVGGNICLFIENGDAAAGMTLSKRMRYRNADNVCANNEKIIRCGSVYFIHAIFGRIMP